MTRLLLLDVDLMAPVSREDTPAPPVRAVGVHVELDSLLSVPPSSSIVIGDICG